MRLFSSSIFLFCSLMYSSCFWYSGLAVPDGCAAGYVQEEGEGVGQVRSFLLVLRVWMCIVPFATSVHCVCHVCVEGGWCVNVLCVPCVCGGGEGMKLKTHLQWFMISHVFSSCLSAGCLILGGISTKQRRPQHGQSTTIIQTQINPT